MITAWDLRTVRRRATITRTAEIVATLARICGENIDIEGWLRTQAARYSDAERQALMLAEGAKQISAAGRRDGAMKLLWEAILTARLARRDVMLEVLDSVAPVLEVSAIASQLKVMDKVLDEVALWLTGQKSL